MVVCDPYDLDVQVLKIKRRTGIWETPELLHDPAADRGHVGVGLQAEVICKIIKAHFRIDQIGIRRYLPDRRLLLIVLIPDLADQLFQNILHGHDAVGAAVFINNDRNVRFGLLELFSSRLIGSISSA